MMIDKMFEPVRMYMASRSGLSVRKYRRLSVQNPQDVHARVGLAYSFLAIRRFDEAVDACKQALELNPQSGTTHLCLGIIYSRRRQYDLAESELRRAIELDDRLAQAHVELARLLGLRGRTQAQEVTLLGAIATGLENAEVYYALGRLYLVQGRTKDARRLARHAINLSDSGRTQELLISSHLGTYGQKVYWAARTLIVAWLVLLFALFSVVSIPGLLTMVALAGWSIATGAIYIRAGRKKRGQVDIAIGLLVLLACICIGAAYRFW